MKESPLLLALRAVPSIDLGNPSRPVLRPGQTYADGVPVSLALSISADGSSASLSDTGTTHRRISERNGGYALSPMAQRAHDSALAAFDGVRDLDGALWIKTEPTPAGIARAAGALASAAIVLDLLPQAVVSALRH